MTVTLQSNWKPLCDNLSLIKASLSINEKTSNPLSKLVQAKAHLGAMNKEVEAQCINKFGQLYAKQELTKIGNRIDGLYFGLKEGSTVAELQPSIKDTVSMVDNVYNDIVSKIDDKVYEAYVSSLQVGKTENAKEILAAATYDNFPDAMKKAMGILKEKVRKEMESRQQDAEQRRPGYEKTYDQEPISRDVKFTGPNNKEMEFQPDLGINKTASRDLLHMTQIMERNESDLAKMIRTMNKSSLGGEDEEFVMVRGPVLTGSSLNPLKLKSANIDFDIVYFPGINFGFARREATPRMYILRDQILIGVRMTSKKKFKLKLNKAAPVKTEQKKFEQLRSDIMEILKQKSSSYMDVTAERDSSNNFIASRKFPHIRFMWIMKESTYNKIGPISSSESLGLPF